MEMRTLTRAVRARPTTLTTTQPASILHSSRFQFPELRTLRFASSNRNPNRQQQPPTQPTPQQKQSQQPQHGAHEFDQIFNSLNLSGNQSGNSPAGQGAHTEEEARAREVSYAADPRRPPPLTRPATAPRKVQLKLGPTLGREIHVQPDRGVDLNSSLRLLQTVLKTNNVMIQARDQKRHTRKGQVRKNVRMRRWRKLFKYSFMHTIERVQRMRDQGW